jgi:hypothetical protein
MATLSSVLLLAERFLLIFSSIDRFALIRKGIKDGKMH